MSEKETSKKSLEAKVKRLESDNARLAKNCTEFQAENMDYERSNAVMKSRLAQLEGEAGSTRLSIEGLKNEERRLQMKNDKLERAILDEKESTDRRLKNYIVTNTFLDALNTTFVNLLKELGHPFKCLGTDDNTIKIEQIKAAKTEAELEQIIRQKPDKK